MAKTEVKENSGNEKRKEIEEAPLMEFVKFQNKGDNFKGVFRGETIVIKNNKDGDKACYVVEDPITEENPTAEVKKRILPTNEKLMRKMENLIKVATPEKVKRGVEIEIEYKGTIKVEGVTNPMKDYSVFLNS